MSHSNFGMGPPPPLCWPHRFVKSDSALHAFSGADSPAASPFGSDERGEVLFSGASSRQSKAIVAFTLLPPARQRAAPPPPPTPPVPIPCPGVLMALRCHVSSPIRARSAVRALATVLPRDLHVAPLGVRVGSPLPPPLLLATTMSLVSCPSSLSCPMSSRAPDASCRCAYRAPSAGARADPRSCHRVVPADPSALRNRWWSCWYPRTLVSRRFGRAARLR